MTLQELLDAGLTQAQSETVLAMHKKAIDGNYEPKSRNQELRNKVKSLEESITAKDAEIETLKTSSAETEQLKKKVEELEQTNKDQATKHEEELTAYKLNSALRSQIGNKVHDVDMVLSLIDTSKIKMDDKGNITEGLKEQIAELQKSKSFLFKTEGTGNPKKPGITVFGKGSTDGGSSDPKPQEDAGVTYAKQAAARRKAAEAGSSKAAEAYFGKK